LRAWIALLAVAFTLTACKSDKKAKPELPASGAQRVVSISPSTTETIYVLGAQGKLVGRSRYCDWPEEVKKLPQIGGYVDPSYEAILALRPDLVIGARGPAGSALTDRLDQRGVVTFFPATETFEAIDEMILGVGKRVDRADAAKAYVDRLHAQLAEIERAVAGKPKHRVLLVFGLEPVSVAGPSSFADEMIRRAGGKNAVEQGGGYPTLNVEEVLRLDPDVVVNAAIAETMGKHRLGKETPGWARVRAVRDDRVVPIGDESVLRPGPRVGDGVAHLAHAIHPDAKIALPDAGPP
jgi:iron complex transport system substrate-binding protein